MKKITFKNGQAPYMNDTNLNLMQDNVEEEINTQFGQLQDNIEEEINTKQNKLVTKVSNLELVGNYLGEVDLNNVARYGNVCRVDFRAKILNDIGDNVTFLKLPFTPAHSSAVLFGIGERYGVSTMKWAYATTTSQGRMQGNVLSKGNYIHIHFTYICQD